MNIRLYQPADRLQCEDIFWSNCPPFFNPEEFAGLQLWLEGQDAGVIKYKTSAADHYYVLELDDKVIACGGFYIFKDKPAVNMAWGMVHRQYHRQGLGKKLLLHRISEAERLYPCHGIMMDTSQHTYPFYEQLGFSVIKITEDGYAPGLHRYDMARAEPGINAPVS